jgi:hypothetical protein
MITVAPAFKVDDRWDTVRTLGESLSRIWVLDPGEAWTLDLRSCEYLGPDASALIYATWLHARSIGQKSVVYLPTSPPQLEGFCRYVGLEHLILKGRRPTPDDPDSETVPLSQVYTAVANQGDTITRLIRRHVELSDDAEFYLGTCLSEAIQNIEDHSQSKIGGVYCARFLSGSGEVRVAVVDRGVGIARSLSKEHGEIRSADALAKVIQGEFSGRTLARNLGLGISNLVKIVRNHRGDLVIQSGHAAAVVTPRSEQPSIVEPGYEFPGTAIFFRFNVRAYD